MSTTHEGYTLEDLAPVQLGKTSYLVKLQTMDDGGSPMVWLHGPRGSVFFLRPFLGDDMGVRQVISWKSGAPMVKQGNEVRVVHIGNVIEQLVKS